MLGRRQCRRAGVRAPVFFLITCAAACASPDHHRACREVLEQQVVAWNRGDLDAFAAGYQRGPHTVFASAQGVQVGFEAMLARYRASYPDRAAMGRLAFSELEFADLAPDAVAARGRWQLTRARDAPWGWFVLVLRRDDGEWRIVLDYTTSGE